MTDAIEIVYRSMEELMRHHGIILLKPKDITLFLDLTNDVLDKKFRLLNTVSEDYERLL